MESASNFCGKVYCRLGLTAYTGGAYAAGCGGMPFCGTAGCMVMGLFSEFVIMTTTLLLPA